MNYLIRFVNSLNCFQAPPVEPYSPISYTLIEDEFGDSKLKLKTYTLEDPTPIKITIHTVKGFVATLKKNTPYSASELYDAYRKYNLKSDYTQKAFSQELIKYGNKNRTRDGMFYRF